MVFFWSNKLDRKIIITDDGSKTIHIENWDEQYHSKHGAIREADHVFLKNGFFHCLKKNNYKNLSILEVGFGTGLNAFMTYLEADKLQQYVNYTGVEGYPVSKAEIDQLNYAELLAPDHSEEFIKMHDDPWALQIQISPCFSLTKRRQFFSDITDSNTYDLIYFDAFGSRVQPELWTEPVFKIMFRALKDQGVLVTYSAKGSARRAMVACGFKIERLQGPPGKRHMLRATK